VTCVTDPECDVLDVRQVFGRKKGSSMFDRRRLRRLPPDIQLEVETLIADLRGERSVPLRPADEAVNKALDARGSSRHTRHAGLPVLRLRRFVGGPRTDDSR